MSARIVSLGTIKTYKPIDNHASFRLSNSTIRDLSAVRRNVSYILYDIDRIIFGLKRIKESFGGQSTQVQQLENLIKRYVLLSDDLYYKQKELNTSAVKLCDYITQNNKDKSNIAANISRNIRRGVIK